MLPSLYISHGSPRIAIMDNPSTDFLKNLSSLYNKPKYILVISAHWTTSQLKILSNPTPELIYDFYGFDDALYAKKYNAINDIKQVNKIVQVLEEKNINITKDESRQGYDHGVWTALSLMYPKADIPVIQLSLPLNYSSEALLNLGEA
ncbi:MAG: dioxygenase, partial [Campylobacteraceae bacterium]|nr:dioxygenase [Campylobacteraceae bacterium]